MVSNGHRSGIKVYGESGPMKSVADLIEFHQLSGRVFLVLF